MSIGIFVGSFDPPTLGHLHVVDRALALPHVSRLAVCVAANSSKDRWLDQSVAARLFEAILPNHLRHSVLVCATAPQKTIDDVNATLRVKGVRSIDDVDYEASNIKRTLVSGENYCGKPLDVLWITVARADHLREINSTAVRKLVYSDRPCREQLLELVPPIAADFLLSARAMVTADPFKDHSVFRLDYNRALQSVLDHNCERRQPMRNGVQPERPRAASDGPLLAASPNVHLGDEFRPWYRSVNPLLSPMHG